jgi:hypothetical protein
MSRIDVAPDYRLLARVLREPAQIDRLSPEEFSRAMDAADAARLLGWLLERRRERPALPDPPLWLADRLVTAEARAIGYERALRWEINRLQRAFLGTGVTWVLMKGAGYIAAGLPPGVGRRVADIDIMVAERDLPRVEQIVREHGWEIPEMDPYDVRYYREWMHELPAMVHRDRRSVLDVHHGILPKTSRRKPPPERLLERSVVENGFRVLCPSHMILQGAAHLFHDGEVAGCIRDLVDLDQLLRAFGSVEGFWDDLIVEAQALDLMRPTYYVLRYAQFEFGTPLPDSVAATVAGWGPPAPIRSLMDRLVRSAIAASKRNAPIAAFGLWVRMHWGKMPPTLLMRHLTRKATMRRH